jgi:hypothetical protein
MVTIPETADWIEVDSAYGGISIYRKVAIEGAEYSGWSGHPTCEHVSLNAEIRSKGFRIFINPRFVNAGYTEHSRHLLFVPGLRQRTKTLAKSLISAIAGSAALEGIKARRA